MAQEFRGRKVDILGANWKAFQVEVSLYLGQDGVEGNKAECIYSWTEEVWTPVVLNVYLRWDLLREFVKVTKAQS